MNKKVFFLFVISMTLLIISCENPLNPKSVNAIVIILGRHANANAFSDVYFEEGIRKSIEDTVYGGYIGVIIGDGNPKVIERFDFFKTEATTERSRNLQINKDANLVIDYLKDESIRAEEPENDLLKAIQEAHKLLNVFEDRANRDGKKIKNKQIIIMDTGIVTTGNMNFLRLSIDSFNFKESTGVLDDFTSEIVEKLYIDRLLPDLSGINVVVIGLGDVASPQEELSPSIMYGMQNLWTVIFKKSNVSNIDFKNYPRGDRPNKYLADNTEFPYVTPIKFEQFVDPTGPIVIYTDQVSFVANSANYLNQENAEIVLTRYTGLLNSYLRRSGVKIYVVGSMAKASQQRDYSTALSERRARTVKDTLVKFGLPEDRLEVLGLGEFYPDREDEWPNGVFTEAIARNNRKVVLIPSHFTEQVREVIAVRDDLARRR
jgi:outer membrane protein OmpA-like peptidoglycan-associated protein